jgi:hypothetical protein
MRGWLLKRRWKGQQSKGVFVIVTRVWKKAQVIPIHEHE